MDGYPGGFGAGRGAFFFPELVYRNARGAVLRWRVAVEAVDAAGRPLPMTDALLAAPPAGTRGRIFVEARQEGGKVRAADDTFVTVGKNLGKKNATNAVTQALRDALGKHNAHARRVQLIDDATAALAPAAAAAAAAAAPAAPADEDAEDAAPVSACVAGVDGRQVCIEMFPPQLLTRLGDSKKATLQPDEFPVDVQRKLNGVRAVAALEREAAEPLLYSRTRKVLAGHPQVRAELARFARAARGLTPARAAHPPVFVYLDGELYRHGQPLHAISGQARRADAAGEVEYHVYDAFFPHSDIVLWRDRRAFLEQLFARVAGDGGAPLQYVRLVETVPAADLAEVRALADRFVAEGYEGAVVRRPAFHYTYSYNNYHSANVLKVKPLYDAEFPVVGFKSGKAGKGADTLLWICRVPEPKNPADAEFTVAPKNLTLEESRRLYACLQQEVAPGVTRFDRDFRGRPLTVEYPELSAKTGKPTQAKATVFRTYEGGPERDPVRAALAECE